MKKVSFSPNVYVKLFEEQDPVYMKTIHNQYSPNDDFLNNSKELYENNNELYDNYENNNEFYENENYDNNKLYDNDNLLKKLKSFIIKIVLIFITLFFIIILFKLILEFI